MTLDERPARPDRRAGVADGREVPFRRAWRYLVARWASVAIALLSLVLLGSTFQAGQRLGMDRALSTSSAMWPAFAISAAISKLVYGAPGYLVYSQVYGRFHEAASDPPGTTLYVHADQGIEHAMGLSFSHECVAGSDDNCMEDRADEIGYDDYVILAFSLFGFSVSSLYYFYFVILGLSVAAFILHFFDQVEYLVLAPLFLAAHRLAVLLLPDNPVTTVVHDGHFLPAVAGLAALHLTVVLTRSERTALRSLPLLAIQLAIVALAVNGRSSALWLVWVPLAGFVGATLWTRTRRGIVGRVIGRWHLWAPVLAVPFLLASYKQLAYDTRYTNGVGTHVIWHSLYMGLGIHPDANPYYDLMYTDATSYIHAHAYLLTHPELLQGTGVDVSSIPFKPARFAEWVPVVGWQNYEQVVKAMYLDFVREHPRFVIESYLIYKPLFLAQLLLWQAGLLASWPGWIVVEPGHMPLHRDPLDFASLPSLLVVIATAVIAAISGRVRSVRPWFGLSGLLFLFSLVPSIVVAPIYYELPIVFVTFALVVYALVAAGIVWLVHRALLARGAGADWRRRAGTGLAVAAALAFVAFALQFRPVVRDGDPPVPPTPARVPAELARDSLGQVWLLRSDGYRQFLPDLETYLSYGGDLAMQNARPIGDDDLAQWKLADMGPAVSAIWPGRADSLQAWARSGRPGLVAGPVTLPSGSVDLALGRPATASVAPDAAPWWQVDLGSSQPISDVQVWPSTDTRGRDEPDNFLVLVSDDAFRSPDPLEVRAQPGVTGYFVPGRIGQPTTVAIHGTARYVRIQMAHDGPMNLAEVQVWSEPSATATTR